MAIASRYTYSGDAQLFKPRGRGRARSPAPARAAAIAAGMIAGEPGAGEARGAAKRRSDTPLADFFARAEAAFAAAAAAGGGPVLVDHRIAGCRVRLRFAPSRLVGDIGAAFAHLRARDGGGDPDLSVSIWDSRGSGTAMPSPPWSTQQYTARGDIRDYDSPRFRCAFDLIGGMLYLLDHATSHALCWMRDAAALPQWITAVPLLPIVHWWMAARGMQVVHAGAVGSAGAGALLAGAGGVGKSNTALTCLGDGLDYVSDDFCLLALAPRPTAYSLYCTGKLHPHDLERHPSLRPLARAPASPPSDKAIVFLAHHRPARLAAALPLRAILLPRVGSASATTWAPVSPAAAHRALTAVTLHMLPGAGHAALATIAEAVRRLPCYVLHLGSDPRGVAAAVRAVLESAR